MTVDYRSPDWSAEVRDWMSGGVNAAIVVPPGVASESLSVVKDGGRLVAISGDDVISGRGIEAEVVPYDADVRDELAELVQAIARKEVRVEIERVYPFHDALAALAKVQTRHARGKVVLRVV